MNGHGPWQQPGHFNSNAAGAAVCGGPENGDACSNRGPKHIEELQKANSSALVQARGISNAHRLPGEHAHPSVQRTNGPEGLGQYTALLMSEDADAHTHERVVAGRRRRVQGHTWFYRPPTGGRLSPHQLDVRHGQVVRRFGASTAPPSMVEHMVSTVPARAECPIMSRHSPSGIHPAYQHGSDADVGNWILDPDTVGDLRDLRC